MESALGVRGSKQNDQDGLSFTNYIYVLDEECGRRLIS